jgi:hypothetical protein
MDPNANLESQREIAETALDSEIIDPDDLLRLAELVVDLDAWIMSGGALPSEWSAQAAAPANARAVARPKRKRRQAGFMDSIQGLLGKLHLGGDDKKPDEKKPAPSSPATDGGHPWAAPPASHGAPPAPSHPWAAPPPPPEPAPRVVYYWPPQ